MNLFPFFSRFLRHAREGLGCKYILRRPACWAQMQQRACKSMYTLSETKKDHFVQEGTAKFADPETVRTVRGRKGSGALGMIASRLAPTPRRASMFDTVPNLTYLPDLYLTHLTHLLI